jgi:hypothetical protein
MSEPFHWTLFILYNLIAKVRWTRPATVASVGQAVNFTIAFKQSREYSIKAYGKFYDTIGNALVSRALPTNPSGFLLVLAFVNCFDLLLQMKYE